MLNRFFCCLALACVAAAPALAQNANSSGTTRSRTTTAEAPQEEPTPTPRPAGKRRAGAGSQDDPSSKSVLDTFNALVKGIEAADVDAVTGAYWNSPQLVLFNNNGT